MIQAKTAKKIGKLKVSNNIDNGEIVVRNSKGYIVANFETDSIFLLSQEERKAEAMKYAKLFEAAPDLLLECKKALSLFTHIQSKPELLKMFNPSVIEIMGATLEQAINKAEIEDFKTK
jgi:hypothetical protein